MSEAPALSTEDPTTDLRGRAARGGAYTLLAQGFVFLVNLGQIAILARLLTPDDFGVVAMVGVVIGFISLFRDAGLSMATIQHAELSHGQASALFWINVFLGLAFVPIIIAFAPIVAWFFGRPETLWITIALAGVFPFSGLAVQHRAIMQRRMQFGRLALLQVTTRLLACGVAVGIAAHGFGFWALVSYQYAIGAFSAIAVFVLNPWRPGWIQKVHEIRSMLVFGRNVVGANMATYLGGNGIQLVIGKALGGTALGIFDHAWRLLFQPLTQLVAPITAVAFPTLSRLQDCPSRFREYYMKAAAGLIGVSVPLIVLLIGWSDQIVEWYLGERWMGVVPILQGLGVYALFVPLGSTIGWLFLSLGKTKEHFRWQIFNNGLRLGAAALGACWGMKGVALLFATSGCVVIPLLFPYVARGGPVKVRDLWTLCFFTVALAAAGFSVIVFARAVLAGAFAPWACIPVTTVMFGAANVLVLLRFQSSRGLVFLAFQYTYQRSLTLLKAGNTRTIPSAVEGIVNARSTQEA